MENNNKDRYSVIIKGSNDKLNKLKEEYNNIEMVIKKRRKNVADYERKVSSLEDEIEDLEIKLSNKADQIIMMERFDEIIQDLVGETQNGHS